MTDAPILELKKKILTNNLTFPIIFVGDEFKLIDIYIKKIFEVKKEPYLCLDSVEDWVNIKSNKNLFTQSNTIACIKYDENLFKQEDLWTQLDGSILVYQKLNKTYRFYKQLKPFIIDVTKMDEISILQSLVTILKQHKIEVNAEYLKWLITNCGRDYGRCLNELDKLLVFGKDASENLFKEMARQDVFHYEVQDVVFEFVNNFALRDKLKCWKLYEDLRQGEPVMVTITVLYQQMRSIAVVQLTPNATEESTGFDARKLQAIKYKVKKYKDNELVNILLDLSALDRGIKLGKIEDEVGLEQFLCRWL